jgi:Protein of unknown function (DUF2795)
LGAGLGWVGTTLTMQHDCGRKGMSLGNLGDLGNLNLGQLQQFLPDVNFPADKDEVLSNLESNNAPNEVLDRVRNAQTDTFNSAEEVLQAVQG